MFDFEKFELALAANGSTYMDEQEAKKLHIAVNDKKLAKKLYRGKTYYTLPYIQYMEKQIAKMIIRHKSFAKPKLSEKIIDSLIMDFQNESEKTMGFKCILHEEQRNAVVMAVNCHIGVITGGPGTGKTTVLNAIRYVETHRPDLQRKPDIIFTAPTGKAARRITESVGVEAKTVQKQIGANEYEDTPNIVFSDIMFCDESSMLDTVTIYQLMRALSDNLKLILVGDVDQLPSVGPGAVLRDLIDCGVIPVTKLEKTFRQVDGTCLADNIQYLKKGYPILDIGEDFKIYNDFTDDEIVERLVKETINAREKYGADNVILLTPYRRKGTTCANRMNELLQGVLNKSSVSVETDIIEADDITGEEYSLHVLFKLGDPVMQLVNLNDAPVANGDVGKIVEIYSDDKILVDFGHCTKVYASDELNQLNLAYAMSVHKSQGSEYKAVITCALPEHKQLLNRNMIYTAVTRAKKECILYATQDVLTSALKVEGGYIRTTFLCEELQYQEEKRLLIESAVA